MTGNLTLYYDFPPYDDSFVTTSPAVVRAFVSWKKRSAAQTINCEISVNNFSDGQSSDPDETATPARGLNQRTVTLVRSGDKFIKTITGEDWLSGSPDRVRFESTDAFDGSVDQNSRRG